ncbi:MAG: LamG-like jellyroll fold domain-containing protein, partial [Gaiellaceae bacterium]
MTPTRFWLVVSRRLLVAAYARCPAHFAALVLTAIAASLLLPGPWDATRAEAGGNEQAADRELVELRSAKTTTVRQADGSLKTTLSEQSLHYLDSGRKWKAIDPSFKSSAEQGTRWESGANRFSVELAEQARESFLTLRVGDVAFSLSVEDASAVQGVKAKENVVTFKDGFPGVDLEYVLLPDGLKENIVLRRQGAPSEYRFRLDPEAGTDLRTEERDDGSIWLFEESSPDPAFVLLPPVAGDSSDRAQPPGAEAGPSLSWAPAKGRASIEVEEESGSFFVTLAIDEDWLRSPDRVYPVVLDPTWYVEPDTADGEYDTTAGGTPNMLTGEIRTGRDGAGGPEYASVLGFDLATIPPGAKVLDARLNVHLNACFPTACGTGHTGDVELRRLTSGWSASTPWSAVTVDSALQDKIVFSTTPAVAWHRWSGGTFSQTVQSMVNGTIANHGVILKKNAGNDAVGYRWRSARYGDPAFAPFLEVFWIADGVQLNPSTHLHANGAELFWQHYAGGTGGYADAVFEDGPVGYWRLDEAPGDTTVWDWSGNDGTATIQNPTGAVRAEPGPLADLDAATKLLGSPAGYVKVPDDPVLRVNDTFTLEAWVRRLDLTARDMAIFNDFGSGFWFRLNYANKIELLGNGTGAPIAASTSSIADTNWHHVAATKAGMSVKLYIDGVDVTGTVTNVTLASSTSGFHIGNTDGLTQPFYGWVDEAALYPTALSAARVQAHYAARATAMAGFQRFEIHRSPNAGFTPSTATLVATVADPALQSYRDTSARPSATFYYQVVTVTDEGAFSSNQLKADLPAQGLGQVTIQPGYLSSFATATHISSGSPTQEAGNSQALTVGSSGSNHTRTLITFDMRLIPTGASVSSAKLHMYALQTTPALDLHRVSAQWWEGGATWNHRDKFASLLWATPGGDFDSSATGSSAGGSHQHWDTWELGSLLQQWIDGSTAHHGVLVKYGSESGSQPTLNYAADGYARSLALRPKLVIAYEDGSQAVAPKVAVSQPVAGELVKGTTTVMAGALDDGTVAKVEFFLDGSALGAPDTAPPFEATWNSTSTSRGDHTLTAKATDEAGNETTSQGVTVTVANSAPPTTSVTVVGAGSSYSGLVLGDSPASYWRLGEASGTSAEDATSANRDGAYSGSPTLGASGALTGDPDTAVGFNGSSQYAEVPYAAALNPSQFSVEAWAYVTGGQGTYRSVVTSRDSATEQRGYVLYAHADDTWQFWVGSGPYWTQLYGPAVQLNTWTHLVGTYDGSTARFYVNGAPVYSTATAFAANTQRALRIGAGRTESTPGFHFAGRVDEAAVYASVLSATQVDAHYDDASSGGSGGSAVSVPLEMSYDPGAGTQDAAPLTVSLTNKSTQSWPTASIKLRYRWFSADSPPIATDSANVSIGTDLGAGQQRDVALTVDPPTLPTGVYRAPYLLRIDLYDTGASSYFAAKGNTPYETWVTVTREVSDELGLERYQQYDGDDLGGGFDHAVNLANGNSLVQWMPFSQPGRGLNSVLTLTYNSLEHGSVSPLGNNWSLASSSLTPFGLPLDVHPNAADTAAGRTQKWVGFTDGDGSYH